MVGGVEQTVVEGQVSVWGEGRWGRNGGGAQGQCWQLGIFVWVAEVRHAVPAAGAGVGT